MRSPILPVAAIGGTLAVVAAAALLINRSSLPVEDLDIGERGACELLTDADVRALGHGDVLPGATDYFCAWAAGVRGTSPLFLDVARFEDYDEFAERADGSDVAGYPADREVGMVAVAFADPGVFTVHGEDDAVAFAAAARILANLGA
ncbi:MAG TPA: hypothetical protein VGF17_10630 [Phytomonospora sp.]